PDREQNGWHLPRPRCARHCSQGDRGALRSLGVRRWDRRRSRLGRRTSPRSRGAHVWRRLRWQSAGASRCPYPNRRSWPRTCARRLVNPTPELPTEPTVIQRVSSDCICVTARGARIVEGRAEEYRRLARDCLALVATVATEEARHALIEMV